MSDDYKIKGTAEQQVFDRAPVTHPGRMIRHEIDGLGLSVDEAAGRMDVPRDRLAAVMDGREPLDTILAERLAILFGPRFSELALRWQIAHDQEA